jgi:hypothetical protein
MITAKPVIENWGWPNPASGKIQINIQLNDNSVMGER